ncbi:MAG: V-type ATP synthase subunit E [Clostridia bacterium]|nr:V-type ATP synthase subunit E [Clostridia bacterium]
MAADNKGADKLISSILEEAHAQASAIEWHATEAVDAIRKKLDRDRELLREEFDEKARAAREESMARARTNAELAARKDLLARKRGLIDEAYGKAYESVCALSGEKREALLKALLERECEGGETVCPSEKDRAALEKLLPLVKGLDLKLGETDHAVTDGFVIKGENYVKGCSFEALMDEVRASTQADVVKALFK